MTEEQIYAKLTEIFRDILDQENLVLKPEMTAADVPNWDSFNHINIVVMVESVFEVKFKSGEVEELKNVRDLVSLIEAKVKK